MLTQIIPGSSNFSMLHYQQPIYSSQNHMPDEERRKIGITPAMFRVSVGIENVEDLIADFTNALSAIQ